MNEKTSDAEVIFHHAIKLPTPQERAAYLAGACEGQDELRVRVEALIEAHEVTSSVLSTEPKEDLFLVPDRPLAEQPGTIIGRYRPSASLRGPLLCQRHDKVPATPGHFFPFDHSRNGRSGK